MKDQRYRLAKRVAGYSISPSIQEYWDKRLDFDVQELARAVVNTRKTRLLCLAAIFVTLLVTGIWVWSLTENVPATTLIAMSSVVIVSIFFLTKTGPFAWPLLTFENWCDGVCEVLYGQDHTKEWMLQKSYDELRIRARNRLIDLAIQVLKAEAAVGREGSSNNLEFARSNFNSTLALVQGFELVHGDPKPFRDRAREIIASTAA